MSESEKRFIRFGVMPLKGKIYLLKIISNAY